MSLPPDERVMLYQNASDGKYAIGYRDDDDDWWAREGDMTDNI